MDELPAAPLPLLPLLELLPFPELELLPVVELDLPELELDLLEVLLPELDRVDPLLLLELLPEVAPAFPEDELDLLELLLPLLELLRVLRPELRAVELVVRPVVEVLVEVKPPEVLDAEAELALADEPMLADELPGGVTPFS